MRDLVDTIGFLIFVICIVLMRSCSHLGRIADALEALTP